MHRRASDPTSDRCGRGRATATAEVELDRVSRSEIIRPPLERKDSLPAGWDPLLAQQRQELSGIQIMLRGTFASIGTAHARRWVVGPHSQRARLGVLGGVECLRDETPGVVRGLSTCGSCYRALPGPSSRRLRSGLGPNGCGLVHDHEPGHYLRQFCNGNERHHVHAAIRCDGLAHPIVSELSDSVDERRRRGGARPRARAECAGLAAARDCHLR
jgi:hypothetical protein